MPELPLDEITLHYEVDGSGPPLLLISGMLSDSAAWAGFAPLLTDRFTVIRADNRTTGRTRPWNAPMDCARLTADLVALMDHLGHGQYHVAGHSMGGLLTLELAALHPEKVASAAVLASGRFRIRRTTAVFEALSHIRQAAEGEEMWLRALYPWLFGNGFFEDPQNVEDALAAALAYPYAQTARAMAHQIEAFSSFRPAAKLDQITQPTLVLYAGQDALVPPDLARASFEALPNASHATIAEAGHSIMWDAPEAVAQYLGTFLAAHPIGEDQTASG